MSRGPGRPPKVQPPAANPAFAIQPGEPVQVTGEPYMGQQVVLAAIAPVVHDRIIVDGETAIVMAIDAAKKTVKARSPKGTVDVPFADVVRA